MKKLYLLIAMLGFVFTAANAKGDIKITTNKEKVAPGETVDIIVSMTNEENEVRDITCDFTLPEGLTVVANSFKKNMDRLEDMTVKAQLRDGGTPSQISVSSLSGDVVYETEGELFRFAVKVDENLDATTEFAVKMRTVVSYHDLSAAPDKATPSATFFATVQQTTTYSLTAAPQSLVLEDEAEISISLNNEKPILGLQFFVTIPDGMTFVKNKRGTKVEWTLSNRVSEDINVGGTIISDNTASFALIDDGTNPITEGNGVIVSFKVKGSLDLDMESKIVIDQISISDANGNDTELQDIEISVLNKALRDKLEEERVAANDEAYNADINAAAELQEALNEANAEIAEKYADYADEEAAQAVQGAIDALVSAADAEKEAKAEDGEYETQVTEASKEAINADIEKLISDAAEALQADNLEKALQDAYELSILSTKLVDIIAQYEEYINLEEVEETIGKELGELLTEVIGDDEEIVGALYEIMDGVYDGVYESKDEAIQELAEKIDALEAEAIAAKQAAEEEATAINGVNIDGAYKTVYTISGVKVRNASKGIFIINGKKVARK